FEIRFADDRSSFHPGERIRIIFSFRRYDISPHDYSHCPGLGISDAVLDHADGTADPEDGLWNSGIMTPACGLLSGVIGSLTGRDRPVRPIEFPIDLNRAVRFDRPGRYRVYIRSHHRFNAGYSLGGAPLLISNILTLDIGGPDPDWAARTLDAATRQLEA